MVNWRGGKLVQWQGSVVMGWCGGGNEMVWFVHVLAGWFCDENWRTPLRNQADLGAMTG